MPLLPKNGVTKGSATRQAHNRRSHVTRHASRVTRHASPVTRHPSPVTHYTSHATLHTPRAANIPLTCDMTKVSHDCVENFGALFDEFSLVELACFPPESRATGEETCIRMYTCVYVYICTHVAYMLASCRQFSQCVRAFVYLMRKRQRL